MQLQINVLKGLKLFLIIGCVTITVYCFQKINNTMVDLSNVIIDSISAEYFQLKGVKIKNSTLNLDQILRFQNSCSEVSMEYVISFANANQYANNVPRIIHYVYKDRDTPEQYLPLVRNCIKINRNVLFLLWSDASAHKFMLRYFPDRRALYESYIKKGSEALKQSDIIRYFLLLKLGGVYMDLDTRCQKPLDGSMVDHDCILNREPETQSRIMWGHEYLMMNSFMACVPRHSFFAWVVDKLPYNIIGHSILEQTGPMFLTRVYKLYLSSKNESDSQHQKRAVFLAPTSLLGSIIEPMIDRHCVQLNNVWRIKGCKELNEARQRNVLELKNAYIIHEYYHLGYYDRKIVKWTIVDICTVGYLLAIPVID